MSEWITPSQCAELQSGAGDSESPLSLHLERVQLQVEPEAYDDMESGLTKNRAVFPWIQSTIYMVHLYALLGRTTGLRILQARGREPLTFSLETLANWVPNSVMRCIRPRRSVHCSAPILASREKVRALHVRSPKSGDLRRRVELLFLCANFPLKSSNFPVSSVSVPGFQTKTLSPRGAPHANRMRSDDPNLILEGFWGDTLVICNLTSGAS